MFIRQGKTNWVLLVVVAMVAGAVGDMLSTYINDSIRAEIVLANSAAFEAPIKKVVGAPALKCGMGEGYEISVCDTSCTVDSDCQFACGCGAMNKNETCNTNGVVSDCVNMQVSCQNGKCVTGERAIPN